MGYGENNGCRESGCSITAGLTQLLFGEIIYRIGFVTRQNGL